MKVLREFFVHYSIHHACAFCVQMRHTHFNGGIFSGLHFTEEEIRSFEGYSFQCTSLSAFLQASDRRWRNSAKPFSEKKSHHIKRFLKMHRYLKLNKKFCRGVKQKRTFKEKVYRIVSKTSLKALVRANIVSFNFSKHFCFTELE